MCTTVVRLKFQCLWGKRQKRVFLDVSEDVLMSFCVAGVALCDIRGVSGGMCVRDRRETKVPMSMGEATQTCLSCQKMCSCRFAWQAWRFVTFDVFQLECVCMTILRVKVPCLWEKSQKRSP